MRFGAATLRPRVGVKQRLMTLDLRWMDRGLGRKAVTACGVCLSPAQAVIVRKSVNTASIGATSAARAANRQRLQRQRKQFGVAAADRRDWRVAPIAADRSSPPHIRPVRRGWRQDFAASDSVEAAVSMRTTMIQVLPLPGRRLGTFDQVAETLDILQAE